MKIQKDYEELLKLFNKHKVKYCIIGAFATAFYALPRYTKDLDILVEPSLVNGKKIIAALKEFGFGSLNLSPEDFNKKNQIIQLGYEPVRIDLMTSVAGVDFAKVWKNKKLGFYGKEKVFFIGLEELIISKRKAGRPRDLADLEVLLEARKV